MPTPEGKVVALWLVTGDDDLAAAFAAELEARGTRNPVIHFSRLQECLDHLATDTVDPSASIAVLDLRAAPQEAMKFLNELHNRYPFAEPVTFLIGAGDHEAEILAAHERFIAGQLPEEGPGAAFVEWAASMLAENWSFEESGEESGPGA